MIRKKIFLLALTIEGKVVTPEQRELIKEADAGEWELFIARLLVRTMGFVDLNMLKGKWEEVG